MKENQISSRGLFLSHRRNTSKSYVRVLCAHDDLPTISIENGHNFIVSMRTRMCGVGEVVRDTKVN